MEQDTFIEKILNSTNGITKVNPSDSVFSKIQQQIDDIKPIDITTKWLIAASIILLISLNIGLITKNTSKKENLTQIVSVDNNQLYN
jgi:hypothetical protein